MKYFIIGLHSSGKQEVIDYLKQSGIKCGKLFSNIEESSNDIYNSYNYELYSTKEVHNIFENNAYIFLHSLEGSRVPNSYKYYEGLSFYEFDNNDVFMLSPDQIVDIPKNIDKSNICYVWMDNTRDDRISRYSREHRSYDFKDRDYIENKDIDLFVKTIYERPVLYFTNEDPVRIATIIKCCVNHPDTLEDFINTYN